MWGKLAAELTRSWSQKELDLTGRKERVAPGVKHQPTSLKYCSCDGYELALKTTAGDWKITKPAEQGTGTQLLPPVGGGAKSHLHKNISHPDSSSQVLFCGQKGQADLGVHTEGTNRPFLAWGFPLTFTTACPLTTATHAVPSTVFQLHTLTPAQRAPNKTSSILPGSVIAKQPTGASGPECKTWSSCAYSSTSTSQH